MPALPGVARDTPMAVVDYRLADLEDVAGLAKIRAEDWGDEEYWRVRISGYLRGEIHPRHSLKERVIFAAEERSLFVGFIAGHLTLRHDCQGELEWITVVPEYRRKGVASALLGRLAEWFGERDALRVCVDVSPDNEAARAFYRRHGAEDLKPHWMVWKD